MALVERLALLVTADTKDAVRELRNLERTADRSLGKTEDRIDKMGATFTKTGAVMLAAGGFAAAGLYNAAQASADLAESVNLTERVFGDASDEIGSFASTAADDLGLSERAARDATSQFGLLLQNLGVAEDETVGWSQSLTTLAADLGSAFNKDPADAVVAIGAAIRGESEPIRQFGVFLDDAAVRARAVEMGLASTTAEVDNHGKAQARLSLIMEQTQSVQGDFAATADGAANAQRRLSARVEEFRAELGTAALPVLEDFLSAGNSSLTMFSQFNEASGGAASTIATFGTAFLLVGGALSTGIGQVIKYRDAFARFGTTADGTTTMLGRMKPAIAGVSVALGAGVVAWQIYENQMRRAREEGDAFAEGVAGTHSGPVENFAALEERTQSLIDKTEELYQQASGMDNNVWDQYQNADAIESLNQAAEGTFNLAVEAKALEDQALAVADAHAISSDEAARWISEQEALGTTYESTADAVEAYGTAVSENNGVTLEAAQSLEEAEEALKSYQNALRSAVDPWFALQQATLDNEDAQSKLNDAVNKANSEGWNTENTRAYHDALNDVQASALDVTMAQTDLQHAVSTGETSIEDATLALEGWEDQGLLTTTALQALKTELFLIAAQAEKLNGTDIKLNIVAAGPDFGMQDVTLSDGTNTKAWFSPIPQAGQASQESTSSTASGESVGSSVELNVYGHDWTLDTAIGATLDTLDAAVTSRAGS